MSNWWREHGIPHVSLQDLFALLIVITSFFIIRKLLRAPKSNPVTNRKETSQNIFNHSEMDIEKDVIQPLLQKHVHSKKDSMPDALDVSKTKPTVELNIKPKEKPEYDKKESKRISTITHLADEEVIKKVIKSEPDPGKSTPKRIGYTPNTLFEKNPPFSYPLVKMPKPNSLIKFPRKGRSEKKGYTEENFKKHLIRLLSLYFEIHNDHHLPTKIGRPYEPDFVLKNERDNKNIFINVEIDEPYDGWTKTPTHCGNNDQIRDEYFTSRGWIVIRFAEEQVHKFPEACCSFIAKVTKSIDPSFNSAILNNETLTEVKKWDALQANLWASQRYREKYLNISDFGHIPNIIYEYQIVETESDRRADEEASEKTNTIIPKHSIGSLAAKNKNLRDARISFDPVEHRYFIDGNPDTISVTQLVEKFFPEFDSKGISTYLAGKRGVTPESILKEWEVERDKGTALHEAIENYYNNNSVSSTKEFQYFLEFKKKYPKLIPHRSEWRIFDEDLLIAGTVDMVYQKEDGSLFMFDWKRSKNVVLPPDGKHLKLSDHTSPYTKFGYGGLSHLTDDSYYKYALQQNIYRAILERKYNFKISSMNLLVLHENYSDFVHVSLPDMTKEVNYIFKHVLTLK